MKVTMRNFWDWCIGRWAMRWLRGLGCSRRRTSEKKRGLLERGGAAWQMLQFPGGEVEAKEVGRKEGRMMRGGRLRGEEIGNLPSRVGSHAQY